MHWQKQEVESTAGHGEQGGEWNKVRVRGRQGPITQTQAARLGTLHFIPSMMVMLWRLPGMGMWWLAVLGGHEPETRVPGKEPLGGSCNSGTQGWDWKTVTVKFQKARIFCFVDHKVSVATIQFCACRASSHRWSVNERAWLCSNKLVYQPLVWTKDEGSVDPSSAYRYLRKCW